jgi:sialate O-acetylesterase
MRAIICFIVLSVSFQSSSFAVELLKVHGIFKSNMVLQRDKPIMIWGWAPEGTTVTVTFGKESSQAKAMGEKGRWEVTFKAKPANSQGQDLVVKAGGKSIAMKNILMGDIWVMNGQSNMAFSLTGVYQKHFEASMAHLPLMRHIRINSGAESEEVEVDIDDSFINGQNENKDWSVVSPEVAMQMGAIGYIFGSRLQRSLQVPIGIIDNGRGGASMESLVPRHKFAENPMAAEYLKWVDKRHSDFSEEAFLKGQMDKWMASEERYQKQIAEDKKKGLTRKRRRPRKPNGSIRTWSVPGRSPSDAASCYNGMFGFFKGLNIKGVAFHQGYNNAMMNTSCKPKFYRALVKLMVEGWREDFNDPQLPVAIIGFCAGGGAQTRLNFEKNGMSTAAYIRESQRLGLRDISNPESTAFIPSYDQKIPQLHTKKKKELGIRTARWALNAVYGNKDIIWDSAKLVSAVSEGDKILLTFDKVVKPDDFGSELEGFSIADKSGVYYMAHAEAKKTKVKDLMDKQILVSSPLVKEAASVRYAWARAPMGNLKVDGLPWQPLHSFRTDKIDFAPEVSHMDPDGKVKSSEAYKVLKSEAATALKTRLESL